MAALRSPFYADNLNLISLRQKIERLDYTPLPTNFYSTEVCFLFKSSLFYILLCFLATFSHIDMSRFGSEAASRYQ